MLAQSKLLSSSIFYCDGASSSYYTKHHNRHIHTTTAAYHASKHHQKDLFTPSPFSRSSKINVSDKFAIYRDLKEIDAYGIRRYLLIPRNDEADMLYDIDENYSPNNIIASLNANRNVLFGAQLHINDDSSSDDEEYASNYLAACGSLLDIAKEDASINGQQVQALATLNGLCSWVKECLDNDGEGSKTLLGLMHGAQQPNGLLNEKGTKSKLPSGKRSNQRIATNETDAANLILKNESQRIQMLEAIRAIATGIPRPGHSVVGQGTYRDGMKGWVEVAREYSQLATSATANNDTDSLDTTTLDASYVGRPGLEELTLYKSRDGTVTKIEHLAHTSPEYLKEAGGAMARLFFV